MVGYRYRLKKMDAGSERYGVCEVCKKSAKEMYMQTEEKQYRQPNLKWGWTNNGHTFGHKSCLMKKRKE